jgi:hypothetical protein
LVKTGSTSHYVLQWPGKHHQNKIQSYIALFFCSQNPSSGLPAATISRDSHDLENFPAPKRIKNPSEQTANLRT